MNRTTTEWKEYGDVIEQCASILVKDASRTVVCTIAEFAHEWSKDTKLDLIIIDEAITMTEAQLWRGLATVIKHWRSSLTLESHHTEAKRQAIH